MNIIFLMIATNGKLNCIYAFSRRSNGSKWFLLSIKNYGNRQSFAGVFNSKL